MHFKQSTLAALTLVLVLVSFGGVEALRLKPKWREFFEEILEEDAKMAEMNIFGRPVEAPALPKFDKKVITYSSTPSYTRLLILKIIGCR